MAASISELPICFVNLPDPDVSLEASSSANFFSDLVRAHAPLVRDAVAGSQFLGFLLHHQSLHDDESVDVAEFKGSDAELEVPRFVNSFPAEVFPSVILDKESGGTDVFIYHARRFRQVKGIVVNAFMELEFHAVNSFCSAATPPIYLVAHSVLSSGHMGLNKVVNWLDDQPSLSVAFLCFGSHRSFGLDQVEVIAYYGLSHYAI